MKKILSLILCTIIPVMLFSGCKTVVNEKSDKLKIVTSVFPVYDFAKNICGDFAEVSMLVPAGNDVHNYEPSPNDIIKLINSDLFICIGGESESWVSKIKESAELSDKKTLSLIDSFELLHEEESHDEHSHHKSDEHIWTSVKNASEICRLIYEKLISLDGENASYYSENLKNYTEKLNELDSEFTEIVKNAKRNTVVFGDRFPFLYFVNDYGLEYFSAFPGCASETEPSAATVAELTDRIKAENIPVVFHIEFSNEKVADILCENTGAEKLLFHSCHSVTAEELQENISYIELMKRNSENLKEALN